MLFTKRKKPLNNSFNWLLFSPLSSFDFFFLFPRVSFVSLLFLYVFCNLFGNFRNLFPGPTRFPAGGCWLAGSKPAGPALEEEVATDDNSEILLVVLDDDDDDGDDGDEEDSRLFRDDDLSRSSTHSNRLHGSPSKGARHRRQQRQSQQQQHRRRRAWETCVPKVVDTSGVVAPVSVTEDYANESFEEDVEEEEPKQRRHVSWIGTFGFRFLFRWLFGVTPILVPRALNWSVIVVFWAREKQNTLKMLVAVEAEQAKISFLESSTKISKKKL